jgi:hypothetical protein
VSLCLFRQPRRKHGPERIVGLHTAQFHPFSTRTVRLSNYLLRGRPSGPQVAAAFEVMEVQHAGQFVDLLLKLAREVAPPTNWQCGRGGRHQKTPKASHPSEAGQPTMDRPSLRES